MLIGKLKSRIKFEQLLRMQDAGGGFNETWVTVYQTWAQVKPSKGRRLLETGKVVIWNGFEIHCRYRADKPLSDTMRIVYKNRPLTIQSLIMINEAEREYEIIAQSQDKQI